MCLGQLWTEVHVCAHLESLVGDECIRQVSVLEDERATALVTLEFVAVLLGEGLSVQKPAFLATLPECSQVVIVYLVPLGDSVALVRAASLVRGNAGCGARGVDDGVLYCVLQAVVVRETHHPREEDVPGLAVQHTVMQLVEAHLKIRVILLVEVFSQLVHFELTLKSQDVNRAVVVDYPEKAPRYWRQLAKVPDGDDGPSSEVHSPFAR